MNVPTIQLGDICDVVMGQSPPSSTYNTAGSGLPFFQGKADFGDLFPTTRVFCTEPVRIAEPGDILISVRAPVGPTNLTRTRCCIGRGLSALRPSKNLQTRFLFYFLRYYEQQLAKLGLGSTFAAINRDDLEEIPIAVPSLSEQDRIVQILDKTDHLRRICRNALQMCDEFLPAAFLEKFGRPDMNQHNYPRAIVEQLGEVETGSTPPRERKEYFGTHVEWIKSDNITLREIYPTRAVEGLSVAGENVGTVVEPGSLLVTCIAGSIASIGNVVLTNRRVAFNQQINAITPYADVDPLFLYGLMLVAKPLVQRGATEAMKKMITKGKLEELVLFKPSLEEQRQFATVVALWSRMRQASRESLRQADHLFQTLLHKAFADRQTN